MHKAIAYSIWSISVILLISVFSVGAIVYWHWPRDVCVDIVDSPSETFTLRAIQKRRRDNIVGYVFIISVRENGNNYADIESLELNTYIRLGRYFDELPVPFAKCVTWDEGSGRVTIVTPEGVFDLALRKRSQGGG